MSQPTGDSPPCGGAAAAEEPPPLEVVDPAAVLPHLAENIPLRRAPETETNARFETLTKTFFDMLKNKGKTLYQKFYIMLLLLVTFTHYTRVSISGRGVGPKTSTGSRYRAVLVIGPNCCLESHLVSPAR